jgi:hypothetical protein
MKTYHDKQKLKEFIISKPVVWKTLKGILNTEEKDKCNY